MKNKKSYTLLIIFLIPLLVYLYTPPCGSFLFEKRCFKNGYEGIVYEKYINNNNHNIRVIKIRYLDRNETTKIYTAFYNRDIYPIVEIGDTLRKEINSNELKIHGINIDTVIHYNLIYPRKNKLANYSPF